VVADGKWHAVQFDLQADGRRFDQRGQVARETLAVMFGNLDNGGYLLAE